MRPIDADAFIKENAEIIDCEIDHPKYQDTLRELIDEAPTIERPRGEWIYVHPLQEDDGGAYMCSVCKTGDWNIRGDENFCSNCGADMRKEGEAE